MPSLDDAVSPLPTRRSSVGAGDPAASFASRSVTPATGGGVGRGRRLPALGPFGDKSVDVSPKRADLLRGLCQQTFERVHARDEVGWHRLLAQRSWRHSRGPAACLTASPLELVTKGLPRPAAQLHSQPGLRDRDQRQAFSDELVDRGPDQLPWKTSGVRQLGALLVIVTSKPRATGLGGASCRFSSNCSSKARRTGVAAADGCRRCRVPDHPLSILH